ncbi:hypothetical protein [Hymenobacter nivis]|uniref:Uncharacterized protein n=1 Tax=Hymenobacter nivis TaxID=1850093 RepID=A0A2Z3GSE3_9BACT|nr:hypothetical protein [Hymenobacter nivis]AWM34617.1 hypothetical protein DDQ68_18635 [Hymenobacter nivis]
MSLSKKQIELTNAKTSVNPVANTKKKSTQMQSPNATDVSAHGNTTDGNSVGHGVQKIRSNPQNNKPMSVNKGPMKKGADNSKDH